MLLRLLLHEARLPLAASDKNAIFVGAQEAEVVCPHVPRDFNEREPDTDLIGRAHTLECAGEWHEAATLWQQITDDAIRDFGEHSRDALGAFTNLGRALLSAGDFDRAAKVLYHTWRLQPRIDLKHNRSFYDLLVPVLHRVGAVVQLIELYEALIPAFDEEGTRGAFEANNTRNGLGEMLRRMERYPEAEKNLREAIEGFGTLRKRGREGAATAWNNLALVYRDTGKPERGAAACRKSVELCRAGSLALLPIALDNLVGCLIDCKRFAEAEPISLEALALAKSQYSPGSEDLQTVLENVALVKINLGKRAEAQPYLIELSSRPFNEYASSSLKSLLTLYEIQLQSKNYAEAARITKDLMRRFGSPDVPIFLAARLRAQKRSIDESFGISDSEPQRPVFDELVGRHRSDVDAMIVQFERLRSRPALFPEASILKPGSPLLGETGISQVITEQSLRFVHFIAEKDLSISDLVKLGPGLGERASIAQARAKAACGQWNEALGILESVTNQGVEAVSPTLWVMAYLERARTYRSMGHFDDAIHACEEALRQHIAILGPDVWMGTLLLAADLFDRLGNREKQFAALIEALSCAQSFLSDPWTLHYLDLEVNSLRNPDARRELVSDKIRIIWEYLGISLDNNITPNVYEIDQPDPEGFARLVASIQDEIQLRLTEHINIDLMQRAAIAFEARIHFVEASRIWLSLAEHFLNGGNFLAYQGTMARASRLLQNKPREWLFDVYRLEARNAFLNGDTAATISCLESALEVAERTRASLSLEQERQGYFGRVADVYRSLLSLFLQAGDAEHVWSVAERASARSLLDHVADSVPQQDVAVTLARNDLHRLQALLALDEAVVMPILQPEHLCAVVIRNDSVETLRWGMGSPIREAIGEFLNCLQRREKEETCVNYARALHNVLLAPLGGVLHGVARIVWIPEYDLAGVPMDSLHDGERYLVEKYQFVQCFSSTLFLRLRSVSHKNIVGALVVGDPGGDLPYARRECDWLEEQLRRRGIEAASFTGDTATLEAVQPRLAAADLIHLSCHGYFNPVRLDRSHIRLFSNSGAAGFLSLPVVSASRLQARLVMLPSCHAGSGRVQLGNEISGFVREFIRAGARTVIAPLWDLEDRVGFELSRHFYTAFLDGKTAAESLRSAKLELLKCGDRDLAGCAHWAPLIVFGDGQ